MVLPVEFDKQSAQSVGCEMFASGNQFRTPGAGAAFHVRAAVTVDSGDKKPGQKIRPGGDNKIRRDRYGNTN
jgi:hypothetical protein